MAFAIHIARPRGFCAGVDRAIEIVERALEAYGAPVYVRHEIVHNRHVVEGLRAKGAVFVNELSEVPDNATVIFSAHGVSQGVQEEAAGRTLRVVDATCPLVTKVHLEAVRYHQQGYGIILIGHQGHVEVEGTMGQLPPGEIHLVQSEEEARHLTMPNPAKVAVITQTTLSVDDTAAIRAALRERFPALAEPKADDICYATQNRQDAVKELAASCQVVLVLGAANSSNSNRLCEVGLREGCRSYLIDEAASLDPAWLEGAKAVGVTAGASAPEGLVQELLARLESLGGSLIGPREEEGEGIVFPLPRGLVKTGG